MDTDRNLLFAVLALQADLIDREQFVQACTLWAARKDDPIADLLVRQGWLTPAGQAAVDQLLASQLSKHGGDARASLADVAGEAARDALATVADADVQQSVAVLTGPYQPSPSAPDQPPPQPTPGSAGRNELYEEIGRGGMGRVLRGRDPDLGRDLAVKVLREDRRGDAGLERRFVEEAQIGGQLQHPGVVPVYELGRFADRRPYFTMKLVKGRTLADWLKERPGAGHDQARFLMIFEQVCQTVAYAHSKGVIHRDLKPANVMIGAFGEVQVMDWGLGKVLATRGADPEAATTGALIRTVRSGSTAEEDGRTGVVGTPAYMAPEQARGEVEAVDERADVFGLGAILCAILTGGPPHGGADREEVLRQATAGDLGAAFVRLGGCGADAELVALCKWCLAPERGQRPRDAGVVAARMAAHQAAVRERLRQAELERAAAEARAAAERRAQRMTVGLAATLLLLVSGGGGGAWWAQHQQQLREAAEARRRQEADAEVVRAMGEARLLLTQAQAEPLGEAGKYRAAVASANKATELAHAGAASQDVRAQATDLVKALEDEAAAAERDRALLAALLEVRGPREGLTYRRDRQGFMAALAEPSADEQFQAAFRAWGLDVDAAPAAEAEARLRGRPGPVVIEVTAALDEWAAERRRRGRPAAEWRRVAELAQALDDDPDSKRRELRALLACGNLARERGLSALSAALRPVPVSYDVGWGQDRSRLRRLAEEADPAGEPVLGLLTLERALQGAGEGAVAERVLRAAVRARPREVVLHDALGRFLAGQRPPRWGEAVECFAVARALRPGLGESLANALVQGGRVGEGLALYERLVAERPDNPWVHFRRGYALGDHGRPQEAEAAYREALRLQPNFPDAHHNLGLALGRQGRYKEAEAAFREALGLKRDFSAAHTNLGTALGHQGRWPEAEVAWGEAIRLKPDSLEAHYDLGTALGHQGRWPEAEVALRQAIRLKPDYPEAHTNLSAALGRQGRHKEAEAALREALRLEPDDPTGYYNLGLALARQDRYGEAEAAFREAIRLQPDYAKAHTNLGAALDRQGRYQEAEAACRQALRLQPDDALAHNNLGFALRDQGRFAEALEELRRGHALGSKVPGWPYPSADWVRQCERLVELDGKLPAVLRGDAEPAGAAERIALGQFCGHYKHRHAAAARLYADALTADPKLADDFQQGHRYNAACDASLAASGRGEDAKHLPDKVRQMLRRQALAWLRADLALYAKLAERPEAGAKQTVRQRLAHWQQDDDLASVRSKAALNQLPDAERQPWRRLWEEVAALLKKVDEKK